MPDSSPKPEDPGITLPMQPTPTPVSATKPSASHYVAELPLPEELQALLGGAYAVESFLGQGGMGAVYKGLQMPLRRPVAIKILAKRQPGEEDAFAFEERFKREAYAMASLAHPHIVQVYDCGDAGESHLFISMELVEGGDLSDAIKAGRVTPEVALKLILQICDGLQAAHDRGLVHRDIKPANIFLTKDGRAKVADFGLAKKFDAQSTFATKTGMSMGTPDYAAPEQFDAIPDIDHRADIYSLGVMFYQMLTGTLPRGSFRPASQRVAVDPRIDAVLVKAMEHDRAERYQSAAEMKADIVAITSSPRTSTAPPAPRATTAVPTVAPIAPSALRPPAQPVPRAMPAQTVPPASSGGTKGAPAPKSKLPLLASLTLAAVALVAGGMFVLKKDGQRGAHASPASPASMSPAASGAPIAAPSLPESGWKPLVSKEEWETNWEGTPVNYGGKLVVPNRRFNKDGLLHIQSTSIYKPGPSPDGALRVESVVRQLPHVINLGGRRRSGDQGRYTFGMASNGNSLLLRYITTDATTWQTIQSCPLPAPLKIGDHLKLELRIQGTQITGIWNGVAVLQAQDQRLTAAGEWGLDVVDATIQSVEVQPLPVPSAEPWQDLLHTPGSLKLKQAQITTEGLRMESAGWALVDNGSREKDGALRMRAPFSQKAKPHVCARVNTDGTAEYRLRVVDASRILLERRENVSPTVLREFPVSPPLIEGEDYELELRVVGSVLSAKLNGRPLGETEDATYNGGAFRLHHGDPPITVKALHFLSLAPKPAVAAPPGLPVSKSPDPKFPPGQWVKLFTETGKLPNTGLYWDNGWIKGAYKKITLPVGDIVNLGVRARFLRGTNPHDSAGGTAGISLHTSGPKRYQLRMINTGLQCIISADEEPKVTPVFEILNPPVAGREYVTEFATVGDRLIARLDGQAAKSVVDSRVRGTGGWITGKDDVRDIEVINLDGLPEAEALRLLGVDEQGNDLRGKTGAAEAWIDVLRNPSLFTPSKGAEFTPEGIRLMGGAGAYSHPEKGPRGDVALRVQTTFGGARLQLRCRGDGRGFYALSVENDKKVALQRFDVATNKGISLGSFTLNSPLKPGEDYEMELRCVGPLLTARLNGVVLGTVTDGTYTDGGCSLVAWETTQGTSIAKAFHVLDLSKPSASSASPSPSLPVSSSPSSAAITAPFVNTLGMKFVPVPITGGPTAGQRLLFSVWETRVQDYEVFAKETAVSWPKPDFAQEPKHPAVNVSWEDAQAFCAWLTEKERKAGKLGANERYRLPSDHEWSCAVGIGDREDATKLPGEKHQKLPDVFPWGSAWPPPAGAGNFSGEETVGKEIIKASQKTLMGYRDEFIDTAPAGSFPPSRFGLFDLGGNAWEWCEDWCYAAQEERVLRGGGWHGNDRSGLLSSRRHHDVPNSRRSDIGFRVVLAPAASGSAAATTPGTAPPAAKQTIDLLALVDPQRDAVAGTWTKLNGELVNRDDAKVEAAIAFPVQNPPEEYDLRLRLQRTNGFAIQFFFGDGKSRGCFQTDGWTGNQANREETRGKLVGDPTPSTLRPKMLLTDGLKHDLVIQVRLNSIEVLYDGSSVLRREYGLAKLDQNELRRENLPEFSIAKLAGDLRVQTAELVPVASAAATSSNTPAAP